MIAHILVDEPRWVLGDFNHFGITQWQRLRGR